MGSFGERLKGLRVERKLTQPELAAKIGVSNGMISFWETGTCEPTAGHIIKLAKFFEVSADYLLGLSDNE